MSTLLIGMADAKTPAGSAGQERLNKCFSAEEARRLFRESEVPGVEINSPIHKQTKKDSHIGCLLQSRGK
ncbi:hypothetical protein Bbad01_08740 [Bacillus badius]|nr:hypothetical protein Bbad01_08740 [Bacillus badius]